MRKPIRVVAALIFMVGAASSGIALVQIFQSNNFANTIKVEEAKLAAQANINPISIAPPVYEAAANPPTTEVIAPPATSKIVSVSTRNLTPVTQVKLGDVIGIIRIPKLDEIYPIIQGTDDKDLKRGVGHFVTSVMPGVKDNSVLSGHRDTVFTKIGHLVKGDLIYVQTTSGIFKYSVISHRIVSPNDKTVIVPTPTAILTLTTCYPFFYIGPAPKRYIVSAQLVN